MSCQLDVQRPAGHMHHIAFILEIKSSDLFMQGLTASQLGEFCCECYISVLVVFTQLALLGDMYCHACGSTSLLPAVAIS